MRAKDGKSFYFEKYLKSPKLFESNLDNHLPHLNLLIHCSYWDKRYPRLVTEEMLRRLWHPKRFHLQLIADLSCDIKGAIEITHKTTSSDRPAFVYHPLTGQIRDGHDSEGICVLAVDNLPCEFPADASVDFSAQIRDYVYQIAAHGVIDLSQHHAIAREVRGAIVTENGKLASAYKYLLKYV